VGLLLKEVVTHRHTPTDSSGAMNKKKTLLFQGLPHELNPFWQTFEKVFMLNVPHWNFKASFRRRWNILWCS
jgi:hypothetical protein